MQNKPNLECDLEASDFQFRNPECYFWHKSCFFPEDRPSKSEADKKLSHVLENTHGGEKGNTAAHSMGVAGIFIPGGEHFFKKIIKKYAKNFVKNFGKICKKFLKNLQKICKNIQKKFKNFLKKFLKFSENFQKNFKKISL